MGAISPRAISPRPRKKHQKSEGTIQIWLKFELKGKLIFPDIQKKMILVI